MRTRARVDANHSLIVRALRDAGCSVETRLAEIGFGCPDLLVGLRGQNFLLEIKNGLESPSKRRLTEQEKVWHQTWRGQVSTVESVEDALRACGLL